MTRMPYRPEPVEPTPRNPPYTEGQAKLARKEFLKIFQWCWFCGKLSSEVHEIAGGSGIRQKAFHERCTWAASCNQCNFYKLTDARLWPHPRQLVVKLINDPNWFDLPRFNWIRGRGLQAITISDLAPFIRLEELKL